MIDTTTTLYRKALGCLLGGLIGDAMGSPAEGKTHEQIEEKYGWIDDFQTDGTDDTVMKNLLCQALIDTGGYASMDDWAKVWLSNWQSIFGDKLNKFFYSVIHTAQKLRRHAVPRMAALGNMPSSSTAMCFSPVGIVNACNPAQAALQAYSLAGLIHTHDVAFCQDGAAAMAAGVAEGFRSTATAESVVQAARAAIIPVSGEEMLSLIDRLLSMARSEGDYRKFRASVYGESETIFRRIACDSRETIPITLAVFLLADGDVEKCVTYGTNFGRDADTIATMAGALGGALNGVDGIKEAWVKKALGVSGTNQEELAAKLAGIALDKAARERAAHDELAAIATAAKGAVPSAAAARTGGASRAGR